VERGVVERVRGYFQIREYMMWVRMKLFYVSMGLDTLHGTLFALCILLFFAPFAVLPLPKRVVRWAGRALIFCMAKLYNADLFYYPYRKNVLVMRLTASSG